MAPIEFGLMLRQNTMGYPDNPMDSLLEFNQRSIELLSVNFTALWMEDHVQYGTYDALECLTTLSYMAAVYPRFNVGMMVLAQSYRNPALLAKMLATLQHLSSGRVILGLGAGWKEDEYLSYGYPFPPVKTRMEQLEDAIQIIRAMWTQSPATFEGKHYQVRDAYCHPQPATPLPILIGGGGEQRTLAIVARHADWWNFNSVPVEEYARKLSILKQHCERIGRDPATIKLTYLGTISVSTDPSKVLRNPNKHYIAGTPDEVTWELEQFSALGITHFIFRTPDLASLENFTTHVAPRFTR